MTVTRPLARSLAGAFLAGTLLGTVGVAGATAKTLEPPVGVLRAAGQPDVVPAPCPALDLNDRAEVVNRARLGDQVFVGKVIAVRRGAGFGALADAPDPDDLATAMPGTRVLEYDVKVRDPLLGDLEPGRGVTVSVGWPGDERIQRLERKQSYLFFARSLGSRLSVDHCRGSQALPAGLSGAARAQVIGFLTSPDEPPRVVSFTAPSGGVAEPPQLTRLIAPGGAISLLGLLGWVLVARLGSRRS